MHKHNGIVVIAVLRGQPRSEVEAALTRADLDGEFTTPVVHAEDGEQGLATNVNLIDEAVALVGELTDARIGSVVIQSQSGDAGWRLA